MEFILPKIYEEILERSFEEEALILRDDQLMSILLIIQENDRIQLEKIRGNEKNLYSLIDNGYVRNESNSFLLTQKGVNFLKLLGISSNFLGSPFSKDIDQ